MRTEKPVMIVYVGGADAASALHETVASAQWVVFHPQSMMEALGMVITYFPDLVIIEDDMRNRFAYEVYMHLRSINAQNLLVLTDHPGSWEIPADVMIPTLPRYTNAQDIAAFIHQTNTDTHHLTTR